MDFSGHVSNAAVPLQHAPEDFDDLLDAVAIDALADFRRFPAWMWRNTDVLDLVGWLLSEAAGAALRSPMLERFIGVVYRPETERQSHYSVVRLADQFDAVFHSDVTRALAPLERSALWEEGEAPETWPTGL